MTQSIIIQVGQCGNQVGYQFWNALLKEHAAIGDILSEGCSDSLSSFFECNKNRHQQHIKRSTKNELKARAVLIDMEEGVVNEMLSSKLAGIFNHKHLITDVSGAGNNWAVGHLEYGEKYRDKISDVIRQTAECCDCLQCFFFIHSMGGGTGSGVGTFVLNLLKDDYPDVFRFVTAVYPSANDDVVTSPYNSVLAMHQLTQYADCVLPIENQALMNIVQKSQIPISKKSAEKSEKAFDAMNNIIANLLLDLTASSRFEGSLNVDLNEISMNLVPYPKLHYLTSSMTPIYSNINILPRHLNQMFTDGFSSTNQLLQVDPFHGLYLGCSLMVRGNVEISDIRQNIERLKPNLNFIHWNQEGWKVGLCSVPPLNKTFSLLTLANNTCFQYTCLDIRNRFIKLFKRKAHLHHYTKIDGFSEATFVESLESLNWLISEYEQLDKTINAPVPNMERITIA